jgi:hypothetical protein
MVTIRGVGPAPASPPPAPALPAFPAVPALPPVPAPPVPAEPALPPLPAVPPLPVEPELPLDPPLPLDPALPPEPAPPPDPLSPPVAPDPAPVPVVPAAPPLPPVAPLVVVESSLQAKAKSGTSTSTLPSGARELLRRFDMMTVRSSRSHPALRWIRTECADSTALMMTLTIIFIKDRTKVKRFDSSRNVSTLRGCPTR